MTRHFDSTVISSPKHLPLNIAAFPGWGVPVLRALVDSAKRGLPREALGHLSPEDVDRGIAAAEAVLEAREAVVERSEEALLVESRELGKRFAIDLFERTATLISLDLQAGRTDNAEPELSMNVPEILKRFHAASASIVAVLAHVPGDLTHISYAYWYAARGEFGSEIVKLIGGMLMVSAETLGRNDELEDWLTDIGDLVMAMVFPGFSDHQRSEAWVQERLDRYEAIRLALRKHHGWDAVDG